MKKKHLFLVLAAVLVLSATIGGTMAWLSDETEAVQNVFTVGNIDITLAETENLNFKMVPGSTISKDPKVTVKAGSEACWLFVKIDKTANLDSFITYAVASNWTAVEGETNVFYQTVANNTSDQSFDVLANNSVSVLETVTKNMMDGLNVPGATKPTLTFTAYAVQQANVATAAEAWDIANP